MKQIFIFLITTFLLTGCLGTKKITENTRNTKQTEISTQKKDSSSVVNTSKAIDDSITTKVISVDPELDAKIDEILSRINTSKTSGSNSYTLNYDRLKREITAELNIGETRDSEKNTNSNTNTKQTFEERTDEYISKKITTIPWWIWAGLLIWFSPQIINRAKMVINPLQGLIKK